MSDDDPEKEAAYIERLEIFTATFECDGHYGDLGLIQDAFLYVLMRFPRHIGLEALDRYIMGRGDRQDPGIMPTAPELAVECRQLQYVEDALGFDVGSAISGAIEQRIESIERRAGVAADQQATAATIEGQPGVVPFRPRMLSPTEPKGAA